MLAFSTISIILLIVESEKSFVTFTSKIPFPLILPLKTSLFIFTSKGRDSPVRADVLRVDSPLTTIPSTGIFSPALTTIISPFFNFLGDIVRSSPFSPFIFA